MNDAVNLTLHSVNLVAAAVIIWIVSDLATMPMVAKAAAGGLLLTAFFLAITAARQWDWTRQ